MADINAEAFTNVVSLFSLQILLPAVLIAVTPKYSSLRFLGPPCMVYIAYKIYLLSPLVSSSVFHTSFLACEGMLAVAHCLNLLVLHGGVSWNDLVKHRAGSPSAGLISRILSASRLIISLRGVTTAWEAKNLPPHPPFLARGGQPVSRGLFLLRQAAILTWQYLCLDVMLAVTLQEPPENTAKFYSPGMEFDYLNATGEQWFIRAFTPFVSWFAVSRLLLDSTWRALSIVFVGAGIDTPEDWRPLFGTMWDVYTLRNFWGKFWHQILRWPFTSSTKFFLRDVLRLPYPSAVERYANIFGVFLLSGTLHAISSHIMGLSAWESGALLFFPATTFGIVLEDSVQGIHRRICGTSSYTPVWQRVIGFIWVQFWMSLTAPWYMYPSRRALADEAAWVLPYNVTEKLGMPAVWGVIAIYGVIVKAAFGTSL